MMIGTSVVCFSPLRDVEAIFPGQHQVEDDQIDPAGLEGVVHGATVGDGDDLVALSAQ